ncbi:phage shock protein C (PspC) family protein [Pseudonocardia hierapolitana]|uniref:Phage shock protein C (PspC) family protein n=2 Tax=Pseudonocardia hierapolitana TaxID=1128676 RepID=A0A561SJB7_9PSEU|nr:phage shock protein C (PspC) family protein [Pseudonocardia hierapolitana]
MVSGEAERRISPVRFTTLRLQNAERNDQLMESIHSTFHHAGLVRPQDGRVLAGVCAGLGRRFGLAPWPARLLFVLILLIVPGSQLLIYPVLWILMPNEAPAVTSVPMTPENETASVA